MPEGLLVILLACFIGVAGGYGAAAFTYLIHFITGSSVQPLAWLAKSHWVYLIALAVLPACGLLLVAWFTRRFAPEAQGHGVPEVISAVARHDGVIRPRVSLVKILASGFCIGTGGSVGREGPIVQIGASLGSMGGQMLKLSARNIKVLVAAGAAAGISATFHAPLAGVMFASEIILGSFAAESLAPIVVASVLADVTQVHVGEHGFNPAFPELHYAYRAAWAELPSYVFLGLFCGLAAVFFTKVLYVIEDAAERWIPRWWLRALILGSIVGIAGAVYPSSPPVLSRAASKELQSQAALPPLYGVGYDVVDHALHLQTYATSNRDATTKPDSTKTIRMSQSQMLSELWWLLPLVLLKPLATSATLAGGGSGGIFAPSLFLGAMLGACFGLLCNLLVPSLSASPGVYAIVGMGAVVAGTTHGVLSAILIVYEMTNDYRIILPIMAAAGLSSVIARWIDRESIYHKKLSRRGESAARAHDVSALEHIMVRDVMVRAFPSVRQTDNVAEIIRVARKNTHVETLPVMDEKDQLVGIIRPEDLRRVLDSELPIQLLNADDIALSAPISVSPDENLLEALRDFGTRDIETLPVESGTGDSRRVVGLLMRADVMARYRNELLSSDGGRAR